MSGVGGGFVAVGLGAMLGAWARWGLGAWLNERVESLPLGTLVANVAGGYLVGIAIAAFSMRHDVPAEWRLFIVTGFLGGLTTFSTFSAENVGMMMRAEYGAALLHAGSHLGGSLLATALGVATWRALAG
jgi:CrcB protein